MKRIFENLLFILLFAISFNAYSAGPGKGNLTKNNLSIGNCSANSITVQWKLDSLLGEPTVNGSFKWNGDENCKISSSTVIWLKIQGDEGNGYIKIAPVIPKANSDYGYNVTGSPNWDNVICGYANLDSVDCLSSNIAKSIWKSGKVTDFEISSPRDRSTNTKSTNTSASQANNNNNSQSNNFSPVGKWDFYIGQKNKSGHVIVTLRSDNSAEYHTPKDGQSFPAKWTGTYTKFDVKAFGTMQHYNKDDPALTLKVTVKNGIGTGMQKNHMGSRSRDFEILEAKKRN